MEYLGKLIKIIKKKFISNKFTRNIMIITSGAVAIQALNMIFSPIITRIYPPEEYGVMAVLSSILMILSFPSFRYELAIPIEKDDNKAINVMALSFISLIIFNFILIVILIMKGEAILSFFRASELSSYAYFIPIGVFVIGFQKILEQWIYRTKDFNLISKAGVWQSLSGNLAKLGTGFSGLGVNGLLFGQVIQQSASIIPLSKNIWNKDKRLIKKINLDDVIWGMKRYKNFPIYQTPSRFLSTFKNQLPVFSLSLYGSQVVGLYGLANSIVRLPMTLIGNSVTNVFYAEAASIGRNNPIRLKLLSENIFKKMIVIGLVPSIILIIWGPQLFSLFFGSNWYGSGIYARFLTIAIYADFIFSPVSRVYEVLERQREKMLIDLFGLILVLTAFLIARYLSESPDLAILMYSVSMCLIYILQFILARLFLNKEINEVMNKKFNKL